MSEVDYDDMVAMPPDMSTIDNIHRRYLRHAIYTSIGSILVSVNPNQQLPSLFSPEAMAAFTSATSSSSSSSSAPHLFGLARDAWLEATLPGSSPHANHNQAILISGESGAGKTEATKLILRYLAAASARVLSGPASASHASPSPYASPAPPSNSIEHRVVEANPILEAFGNAKTHLNENSSRFGKWLRVHLAPDGAIAGAEIVTYLLEESRVCLQAVGERNFSIFYQLCARDGHQLDPADFAFLRAGPDHGDTSSVRVDGVDDALQMTRTLEAMTAMGFSSAEQDAVLALLRGILELGNLQFAPVDHDSDSEAKVAVQNRDVLAACAAAFGVEPDDLERALVLHIMTSARNTIIPMPLDEAKAQDASKSLARVTYGKLFDWIVARINVSLERPADVPKENHLGVPALRINTHDDTRCIGILDIFGFEHFEVNSFEQLAINFANEKLQQHFVQAVFRHDMELYEREQIDLGAVEFKDNQDVLDVLEKKGTGIFLLIGEELNLPRGDDTTLLSKLHAVHEASPVYKKPRFGEPQFAIEHFAAPVTYNVEGFMEKNKAKAQEDLLQLMRGSSVSVVAELFSPQPEPAAQQDAYSPRPGRSPSRSSSPASSPRGGKRRTRKKCLATSFRKEVNGLMAEIARSKSWFVRCIKPNLVHSPTEFDTECVHRQLISCGLVHAIDMRKNGYEFRMEFARFIEHYNSLFRGGDVEDPKAAVQALMDGMDGADGHFQLGDTMVFFRGELHQVLEAEREKVEGAAAVVVQAAVRRRLAMAHFERRRHVLHELQAAHESGDVDQLLVAVDAARAVQMPAHLMQAAETVLREEQAATVLQAMVRSRVARVERLTRHALMERVLDGRGTGLTELRGAVQAARAGGVPEWMLAEAEREVEDVAAQVLQGAVRRWDAARRLQLAHGGVEIREALERARQAGVPAHLLEARLQLDTSLPLLEACEQLEAVVEGADRPELLAAAREVVQMCEASLVDVDAEELERRLQEVPELRAFEEVQRLEHLVALKSRAAALDETAPTGEVEAALADLEAESVDWGGEVERLQSLAAESSGEDEHGAEGVVHHGDSHRAVYVPRAVSSGADEDEHWRRTQTGNLVGAGGIKVKIVTPVPVYVAAVAHEQEDEGAAADQEALGVRVAEGDGSHSRTPSFTYKPVVVPGGGAVPFIPPVVDDEHEARARQLETVPVEDTHDHNVRKFRDAVEERRGSHAMAKESEAREERARRQAQPHQQPGSRGAERGRGNGAAGANVLDPTNRTKFAADEGSKGCCVIL